MIKLHLTPLNLVLAVAVSYGALTLAMRPNTSPVQISANVVSLSGEVTETSSELLVKALTTLRDKGTTKVLLDIDSPGGDVLAGREVHALMNKDGMTVNTFSDNYFMSMGMSFFLEGEKRIVTSAAIGMIHRGSVGNHSYFGLTKKLAEAEKVRKVLLSTGGNTDDVDIALERLHSIVDAMDLFIKRDIEILERVKKTAPNPEKTQAIIDSLKVGNRDIFLTAEEMLEAGIATHIVNSKKEAASL